MFRLKLKVQRFGLLVYKDNRIGANGFTREFGFLNGHATHPKEPLGKLCGVEFCQVFAQVIAFHRRGAGC